MDKMLHKFNKLQDTHNYNIYIYIARIKVAYYKHTEFAGIIKMKATTKFLSFAKPITSRAQHLQIT